MRELTNYELWQLERYGDYLPTPYLFETEQNGEPEARRFAEWDQLHHELLMHESDNDYTNYRR